MYRGGTLRGEAPGLAGWNHFLVTYFCLESLAELGVEIDICTPWVSEPDLDLAGDGRPLRAHSNEPRGCAMVGALGGCFSKQSSKYTCLW